MGLLAESQYSPITVLLSTVAPLDDDISAFIDKVAYTNPMGKLVDFTFFSMRTRS